MLPQIDVVAAVLVRDTRVLLARRPDGAHLAGYWEFPGGKVRRGEGALAALAALVRELREEIGVEVTDARVLHAETFDYPDRRVRIEFFRVERFEGEPRGLEGQEIEWVEMRSLQDRELPPANATVVAMLEAELDRAEA